MRVHVEGIGVFCDCKMRLLLLAALGSMRVRSEEVVGERDFGEVRCPDNSRFKAEAEDWDGRRLRKLRWQLTERCRFAGAHGPVPSVKCDKSETTCVFRHVEVEFATQPALFRREGIHGVPKIVAIRPIGGDCSSSGRGDEILA